MEGSRRSRPMNLSQSGNVAGAIFQSRLANFSWDNIHRGKLRRTLPANLHGVITGPALLIYVSPSRFCWQRYLCRVVIVWSFSNITWKPLFLEQK